MSGRKMRPITHIVSGIMEGTVVYTVAKSISCSVLCAIGNVVCDLDHVLEYTVYCIRRNKKPEFDEFSTGTYFAEKGTLFVLFHAYEYLILIIFKTCLLGRKSRGSSKSVVAFAIGYGSHILLDTIGNSCGMRGYSIVYRVLQRFDEDRLCRTRSSKRK